MFPMVHPDIFRKNPLIETIAGDENWTVSTKDKRPVNAKRLLRDNEVRNINFDYGNPLVSLDDLDANPDLQAVNRTYRLKARENSIIAIDVEPEAPESMKKEVLSFPSHYTELSMNGGVHLLIKVPRDLINDDNRYMFEELSVCKEFIPKGVKRQAYFEVMFNDHFMTFTKKMDVNKRIADFENNQEDRDKLISFLNNLVELDKDRKKERELAKQYQVEMLDNLIDEDKKEDIEKFINLKPFDRAKQQASAKDVKNFGDDYSRYEMSVINGLASHTLHIYNLAKGTISFKDTVNLFTEQDLVHAVYLLAKDIIPYRDKHDEIREGLPWLLYTAKQGYAYIKAQRSKDK